MIEVQEVSYSYSGKYNVLEHVNLNFHKGNLYAILGPSGCGKTTLLSLIGGLDNPSEGKILYEGKDISEYGLGRHRQEQAAFIFQGYNLIEYMTVKENVELTAKLSPEESLSKVNLVYLPEYEYDTS